VRCAAFAASIEPLHDCMDAGGRAKPGAYVEKDGMRGVLQPIFPHPNPLPEGEGITMCMICQLGQ
jgi:hypothetical protein